MFLPLKPLISRLDIPNDGTNRTGRLLNWITIAILPIAVVYTGFLAVLLARSDVLLYGICAILLSIVINVAARRGQTQFATVAFVAGVWLIITVANLSPASDGIYDAAFTAYIVPILLAGFLLGSRSSFILAGLSVLVGLGLLSQSLTRQITFIEARSSSQILHFTADCIFFLVTATLFSLTNNSLVNALKRVRSSEADLLGRNHDLEHEIIERQHIEAALRASDQTAKQFQDKLKALHEISLQLANVTSLDELYKQAIVLGHDKLGFDRIGWFLLTDDNEILQGTYGIDTHGNLDDVHDIRTEVSLVNWTEDFQRFTSSGHVYFRADTVLRDRNEVVGQGWNAFAAVSHGDNIVGWIVADNLLHQQPLQDYQLEIMRLYGAILGQLFVQKQTQQVLTEKENRLQLALDAAQMRSWDWDFQTGVIAGNGFYANGAMPARSSYIDFMSNIHPADQPHVFNAIRNMAERGHLYEAEYRIIDKNEGVHWIHTLGQPYYNENGDIAGIAGVTQDITGRKTIEETLKRADEQAMELIVEKERVSALTEFINTVSHDFKTPLAIINNSLYLLQRINDPVKQKDKLNLIKEQTLLLDKQIQDILTISRLEYAPPVIAHPANINLLLQKIGDLFRPSYENKNLTLNLDLQPDLPIILADIDELDRAFVNLVENAINYTPTGGTISVTTRLVDNHVECVFSDTGIGMKPQDTEQIFDNFYRAENARMINSKGTGLGLAIVKRIVSNHNGSISVESELGKGTAFHLRFPIAVAV